MDIGPGDVVEALEDFTPTFAAPYNITKGTRTIVAGLTPAKGICFNCLEPSNGLLLVDFPLKPPIAWCPGHWRKVGGSREAHVRQFEAHFKDHKPLAKEIAEVLKKLDRVV